MKPKLTNPENRITDVQDDLLQKCRKGDHKAVVNAFIFPKSRLKIALVPPPSQNDVFVSIDKVTDFKRWFDGEN